MTASKLLLASVAALTVAGLVAGAPARAETVPPVAEQLTPEEQKERDMRKACKVAICDAMHNRKAGADVACNVVKTWRKEQIDKMISKAKVSWPWGKVQCTADIKLKRDMLTAALGSPKLEAQLDKHTVTCTIDRDKEAPASIKFEFTPKVTFEGGKATKALLNWGTVDAPTLVKGAMWTATATDNTFNVLQGTVVDDINDFTGAKCDEVKDEWKK
jgi:hypothetical protein